MADFQHLSNERVVGHFLPDGRRFRLTEDLLYRPDVPGGPSHLTWTTLGSALVVPAGFETDFASTPRLLWAIAPPIGRHTAASVIHDWLYSQTIGSRWWADRVFLRAMQQSHAPWWKSRAYYWSVRLFGHFVWRRYEKQKV